MVCSLLNSTLDKFHEIIESTHFKDCTEHLVLYIAGFTYLWDGAVSPPFPLHPLQIMRWLGGFHLFTPNNLSDKRFNNNSHEDEIFSFTAAFAKVKISAIKYWTNEFISTFV